MRYILLAICGLFSSIIFAQNKTDLTILLEKAFKIQDSSEYYFSAARKLVTTKSDSANYLYYKFYSVNRKNMVDSSLFYSNRVTSLLQDLDSLNRLRKVYYDTHRIYLNKGNYEEALNGIQLALSAAERLKDTAMISLHNSDKAIIYHDFEDYKKGVEYGKKAYSIMDRATNKNYKYLIIANNTIGINYDDWKKPDSALFYHYKNLELLKKVDDSAYYGFVFNNIGNTLLKAKKYSEAKKIINRSLVLNKIRNGDYNLATNYTNLATIAYEEGDYKLAKSHFLEANNFAQKSKSIEKIRDVLQQEAWFYKKTGDFKRSLEKQEEFYVLRDSIFNDERAQKVVELETKYETEKKERDLAQSRANLAERELEVEQKNTMLFGSLGIIVVFGLVGYLFYNQQKLKHRQLVKESALKTALAQIETQNRLQEQRLRISRDLHDNIGSQLTFIISSIDSLKYGLKDANDKVSSKLTSISEFTTQTIYELRDTIWAMNKNEISWQDLQVRISNFVENARKADDKVAFTFWVDKNISEDVRFTSMQGMNVYRIIQEAMNNALKYANASKISVSISEENEVFNIEIIDDGAGFDTSLKNGNGLNNIKKRTADLKGNLSIESNNGVGTHIKVSFSI
ncbi:tetratricopeptide repeat-containing sensor histidine kinase [Ulvibacter antarcticus]|uniref:histidine kinase n=1 Tax=Ulvibacter antarcticus TaxID=442714 RepID=A0A3L9YH83_9FLAO|nr:tetratricopeptide repeat protein [Ulvibacter antarcticus]RMA57248.1 histidine kinase/DNA gyrase B/HSP90-like ATPase [Ulvibacter antarcticus]